ncbi:hypothetical protein G6F62_015084 [Rhizopus arrhizus]|nr:hypothetical protein G6F32_014705 [Rhizopus arrhizus]KAG1308178.1 hypothetical protein G6F62_015084 [Rhizopus arrhizus]
MAMKGFFLAAATPAMARLVDEFVPAIMTSTFCSSNHSRTRADATSALFWWSAETTSIFLPLIEPPASSIAMRIASRPALPSMSEYTPDMSVMKPMRMTSSEIPCAWAVAPANPRPAMASAAVIVCSFMG